MQLCNLTKNNFFQVGQLKQFRGDCATEIVPICIHERNEIHQQISQDKYSKSLQQSHFKCNLQKLISSKLKAAPISEGICPVNWFVSSSHQFVLPPICAKRENERKNEYWH